MAKGGGHNRGQKMPYRVVRTFEGSAARRSAHWTIGSAQADMRLSLLAANAGRVEFTEAELVIVDTRTDEVVDRPLKCTVCDEAWATETGPGRADAPSTCRDCEGDDEPGGSDEDVLAPDLPYTPPAAVQGLTAAGPAAHPIPVIAPAESDGDILIAGTLGMGKTSQRAIAELAARYAGPGKELAVVEPKPDTIESALMNLDAGEANGVNVAQALEPAVAAFTPRNALPEADPSALLAALDRRKLPRAVWADGTVAAVANGMLWRMQAEPHAATGEPCGVWSVTSPVGVRGHFVAERAARFIADRRVP